MRVIFALILFPAIPALAAIDPAAPSPPPAAAAGTPVSTATATSAATAPAVVPSTTNASRVPPAPVATEIAFSNGANALDVPARMELEVLLRQAALRGQVTEVQVYSWGDNLALNSQPSPTEQVSLAEQRAQSVADFIRQSSPAPVKAVNVAQRPSALQDLLASPDLNTLAVLGRLGLVSPDASVKRSAVVVLIKLR